MFTYCRQENAILHPTFTQPGKVILVQPCTGCINYSSHGKLSQDLSPKPQRKLKMWHRRTLGRGGQRHDVTSDEISLQLYQSRVSVRTFARVFSARAAMMKGRTKGVKGPFAIRPPSSHPICHPTEPVQHPILDSVWMLSHYRAQLKGGPQVA